MVRLRDADEAAAEEAGRAVGTGLRYAGAAARVVRSGP
jgi:hypothetical protein